MGVITLALVANGNLSSEGFEVPTWVIVSAASAIALGTYTGGWRIIKTMGTRIIKMDSAQGFSAQGAGAAVILASSHFGYPLSTTQVIAGGVMGAGAGKRLSAVRWGVAGDIVTAWLLTLPAAAAIGALTYGFVELFPGAVGPLHRLRASASGWPPSPSPGGCARSSRCRRDRDDRRHRGALADDRRAPSSPGSGRRSSSRSRSSARPGSRRRTATGIGTQARGLRSAGGRRPARDRRRDRVGVIVMTAK